MSDNWKNNPKDYVVEVRNHLIQKFDGYGLDFSDIEDWEYGASFKISDLNIPKTYPKIPLPESGIPTSMEVFFDKEKDTVKVEVNDWNGYMGLLGSGSFLLNRTAAELAEIFVHNILVMFKKFKKPLKDE